MILSKEDSVYAAMKMMNYFKDFHRIDDYFRARKIERVKNIPVGLPGMSIEDELFQEFDLASKGISTAQINTLGKLMDDMVPKENTYWGAASFDIEERSVNEKDDLNALYEKIKADPLILYFNTAEASIYLDAEQRQKVADISRYIDKVEDATVSVVGHTDATGQASTNMRLGQDRAEFAKNYLMQNGIAESKIIATSKGQTQPIATNATEYGREQNRRVEFTITKK